MAEERLQKILSRSGVASRRKAEELIRTRGLEAASPGWIADYDWQGFIPYDQLPTRFNPQGGMIAMLAPDLQCLRASRHTIVMEAQIRGDVVI